MCSRSKFVELLFLSKIKSGLACVCEFIILHFTITMHDVIEYNYKSSSQKDRHDSEWSISSKSACE